ncbi:MAG: tetratricopeptide repeat protein [Paracoccaceae bacterium]
MSCKAVAVVLACVLLLAGCEEPSVRADRHYEDGRELLADGAPEKAALEFRNALRLNESLHAARFELAMILEASGDLTGAVANLRALVEVDPDHVPAQIRLAHAMLLAGDPDQALKHAGQAVAADPGSPGALLARAGAFLQNGDAPAAVADANEALRIDLDNPDAVLILALEQEQAGARKEALALIEPILAQSSGSLSLHMAAARLLQGLGRDAALGRHLDVMEGRFAGDADVRRLIVEWQTARNDAEAVERGLRALTELEPEDRGTLWALVRFLAQQHGVDTARLELQARISKSGAPGDLDLMLAQFNLSTGRGDVAKESLLELISTGDPGVRAAARLLLAEMTAQAGDNPTAIELTSRVIDEDPGHAAALRLRARAYLASGETSKAGFDLRAALEEMPSDPALHVLAARLQDSSDVPSLAGDHYARAVRASGHAPAIVVEYVEFLSREEKPRIAALLLEDALRRHGQDPALLLARARLFAEGGRLRDAVDAAESGLVRTGGSPEFRLLRADLALRSQDPARAIMEFERLLEDRPDLDLAANNLAAMLAEHHAHDPEAVSRAHALSQRFRDAEAPALLDTYGWTAFLSGDLEEAVRALEQAAAGLPEDPWVRYHTGVALVAAGEVQSGRTHLEAALRLSEGRDASPVDRVRQALAAAP